MIIGGLEKFSLIDYPKHLSAVIFTKGCNFRCHFCYNPMLVWPDVGKLNNQKDHPEIKEDDLFDFLKNRVGKLNAVVISGGEPTLHVDLPEFIKKIKNLGFKVKLDSNGTNPKMLRHLIDNALIDYIAMDIKAAPDKYEMVTGVLPDLEKIKKSVIIIKTSGLPYEFRTTIVPKLVEKNDIKKIGKIIKRADKWYLQRFKSDTGLVDKDFESFKAYAEDDMEKMRLIGGKYADKCEIRG